MTQSEKNWVRGWTICFYSCVRLLVVWMQFSILHMHGIYFYTDLSETLLSCKNKIMCVVNLVYPSIPAKQMWMRSNHANRHQFSPNIYPHLAHLKQFSQNRISSGNIYNQNSAKTNTLLSERKPNFPASPAIFAHINFAPHVILFSSRQRFLRLERFCRARIFKSAILGAGGCALIERGIKKRGLKGHAR